MLTNKIFNASALIKGEDVGPRKKLDAKSQKAERPNNFHIFTQKGVANKLGLNLL